MYDAADVVIVAVKPIAMASALEDLGKQSHGQVIVSVAAGLSLATLAAHSPARSPIVRVMPNVNSQIGAGMSALCANELVAEEQLTAVEEIFATVGLTTRIPEKDFAAFSAIAGCSPAWTYTYIDALARGGLAAGLNLEQARQIAAQAVLGSAQLVLDRQGTLTPSQLRDQVTSPAGQRLPDSSPWRRQVSPRPSSTPSTRPSRATRRLGATSSPPRQHVGYPAHKHNRAVWEDIMTAPASAAIASMTDSPPGVFISTPPTPEHDRALPARLARPARCGNDDAGATAKAGCQTASDHSCGATRFVKRLEPQGCGDTVACAVVVRFCARPVKAPCALATIFPAMTTTTSPRMPTWPSGHETALRWGASTAATSSPDVSMGMPGTATACREVMPEL